MVMDSHRGPAALGTARFAKSNDQIFVRRYFDFS
jgi:hypothetical protein